MRLNQFRDRSLLMGTMLAAQSMQNWLKEHLDTQSNFLGSLILVALHFENKKHRTGPSRLANSLGFSRSRVSQEISRLVDAGLLKRSIVTDDARTVTVALTSLGEKRANEVVKTFTQIQKLIDDAIGERLAENINTSLLKLADKIKAQTQ